MAATTSLAVKLREAIFSGSSHTRDTVVALSQVADVAHAMEPGQFVPQLDGGVVAQVQAVAAAIGREQVDDHQRAGRLLGDQHAAALDLVGQHRRGQGDAVLDQHLGDVQIGAHLEGHGQLVGTIVGALGGHVDHVLDAVDLLLDGSGHRVGHYLGVGAGIGTGYFHGGRCDLRVLGDGQAQKENDAHQRDDDGQYRGEDRTIDEEAGKHGFSLERPPPMGKRKALIQVLMSFDDQVW